MFETLRCVRKGHIFVDSRSQPGTVVCARCGKRRAPEGMTTPRNPADSA